MNSTIVLGSMFLQQYNAWWQTNYATGVTTLSLQLASNNTLHNSKITSTIPNNSFVNPFAVSTNQTFPLIIDENYNMFIGGNIGLQTPPPNSGFYVDLYGDTPYVYANNCN